MGSVRSAAQFLIVGEGMMKMAWRCRSQIGRQNPKKQTICFEIEWDIFRGKQEHMKLIITPDKLSES